MQLTPQQDAALKAVTAWLKDPDGPQVFRLFGWAGTGKTTIAKLLAQEARLPMYASFTGKAAMVMRKNGCDSAQTLHSLIYSPERNEANGQLVFKINWESPLMAADLLVVDEVSMVDEDLGSDTLSFGKKVLVLGDPGQLPPIKGLGFFTEAQPDVLLTDIRRQAADNPIIALSAMIREGKMPEPGTMGDAVVILSRQQLKRKYEELLATADMTLVGTNSSRMAVNLQARQIKGLQGEFEAWHPVAGDRLVCLRNDRKKGFLNGSLWTVAGGVDVGQVDTRLSIKGDDIDISTEIDVLNEFFCGKEAGLDWRLKMNYDEFTYAQALTCHKAQGSQWPFVFGLDQSKVFKDVWQKWLYTLVTRAEERLTLGLQG